MPIDAPFMTWIDHLPEVGDLIRRDRTELLEVAEQAAELERHAQALRSQVVSGQTELLVKVMKHWTLADIQAASQAASDANPQSFALVNDIALRDKLRSLDGWHLASEALQVFHDAVIRRHNLLSVAGEDEPLQTLARVQAWWNYAGRPVYERLAIK